MRKPEDFEDDGRTIASMEDVERPSLMGALGRVRTGGQRPETQQSKRPVYAGQDEVSGEHRRWYILGMLRAALMIGGVYIIAFAVIILLLLLLWSRLG